jgi:hypothetical protein
MDYYELLGVNRSASDAEIKRAYRRLSFQYHPDKNNNPQAQELYKHINAAYDVLGDPEKRQAYDLRGVYQFDVQIEPEAPRHRDPRYRRATPTPQQGPGKYTIREVMAVCMKYFVWVNRVGLAVALIYVLDFYLPYKTTQETVSSLKNVITGGGRYNSSYILISTSEGSKIKIRKLDDHFFEQGQVLTIATTRIYATRMSVWGEGDASPLSLGTIYGILAIFPLGVLVSAAVATIFKKMENLAFNMSIICAVLLFVTLLLIFLL